MRLRHLVWLAVATMVLGGCQGEKATITGGYGQGVVLGQVAMKDVDNLSPAGVQVSVRGTGQSVVLGEDGRFTFVDVPRNAVLDFRRDDGISGSLSVAGSSGSLRVSLSRAGAEKSKDNRGRGNGQKQYEFEGLIRSAGEGEIVVFTSHRQEVTIGLDDDTVIRKGGTILSAADLTVDTRVHVKARKVDDAFVANLVIVQNPAGDDDGDDDDGEEDPPEVGQYEGTIVSAGETELVVFTSHKVEVTFVINGETEIRKGNTPVPAGELEAGWRVHVKATSAGETHTAIEVIVQKNK